MKALPIRSCRAGGSPGVALVITLCFLVIITVLVVGFMVSMRMERQAAQSMSNDVSANLLAQVAIDHAVALLNTNIPQPVPPGSTATPANWIINPGLLTLIDKNGVTAKIPLNSNPTVDYASTSTDANLNGSSINGASYTILGSTNSEMRVAWIPILKDPSAAASSTNPIIGRYAFWIDDENSKINLNTAYGKPAGLNFSNPLKMTPTYTVTGTPTTGTYTLAHPYAVSLDWLAGSSGYLNRNGLAGSVGTAGSTVPKPLQNIQEAKRFFGASPTPDDFLNAHKSEFTVCGSDPEFNVFGKSRLFFLRRALVVISGLPTHIYQYFRDAEAPMYFHQDENGGSNQVDKHALYAGVMALTNLFKRSDWPGMPSASFVDKWNLDSSGGGHTGLGQREADQVAWNITTMGGFADFSPYLAADTGTAPGFTGSTSSNFTRFANYLTPSQPGSCGSRNAPNTYAQVGPLSQVAMLPALPRPLVDEVRLNILPEAVTVSGVTKYRLKVNADYELWLPPGYPKLTLGDSFGGCKVGPTYLEYKITQGTTTAAQRDNKYIVPVAGVDADFITALLASAATGTCAPGGYVTLTGTNSIYAGNGTSFVTAGTDPSVTLFSEDVAAGAITVDVKMRLYNKSVGKTQVPIQLIPVWDTRDPGAAVTSPQAWNPTPPSTSLAAFKPPADDPKDYLEFSFTISPSDLNAGPVQRSLEIDDPRNGGLARAWYAGTGVMPNAKTAAISASISTSPGALKSYGYLDFVSATVPPASAVTLPSPRPSAGMLSVIPVGMQRGIAGTTPKFQPGTAAGSLPDWLLLDLLAPTVTTPTFPEISQANATMGKINLNAKIYPAAQTHFAPPSRWVPLQALVQNMSTQTTVASGATAPSQIVQNILNHLLASGGQDYAAPGVYDYAGKICEIAGVADGTLGAPNSGATDWDKEYIIRNLANLMTVRSNAFDVWGMVQTIKKKPGNTNYGVYEAGDIVTGEKRFESNILRYVWPGQDGVAGNGHVNGAGTYDSLSSTTNSPKLPGQLPAYTTTGVTWEKLDGPDNYTYPPANVLASATDPYLTTMPASYQSSSLEQANNPIRALMKYKVVNFRYVND